MKDLNKPKYTIVWIACLIFLVFLAGCLTFISYVRDKSESDMITYLSDVTVQRKAAVYQHINGDMQVLNGVATSMGEMDLSDRQAILNIIKDINKGNAFVRMGIADLDGNVGLINEKGQTFTDIDISGLDAFGEALKGNPAVSDTFYEEATGEYVNYYMMPVYRDDRMLCILCAVDNGKTFENLIDVRVFRNEGYFAIVDSEGIIVAPTVDPNPRVKIGASIFDLADMSPEQEKKMHSVLVVEKNEEFVFPVFGNENLAVVEPLGINGWSIISVVPTDTLNTYFNQASIGIAVLTGMASILFIFILIGQIRSTNKNRRRLENLAYVDQLTGLRNYNSFYPDAQELLDKDNDKKYAIWTMDIKSFNDINDIFGNVSGDRLLGFIGDFFKEKEGGGGFAARTAADDFVGIIEYEKKNDLSTLFMELNDIIVNRDFIPESEKKVSFSMGLYCREDFSDDLTVEEMASRANIAQKEAKLLSGSHMKFFSREMGERLHWNSLLEARAEDSLNNGEMTFMLQPKVSIETDYIVKSAEVLARWKHPQYGIISPGDFIPLFEKNGFIVTFDRYIFRRACKWLVEYRKEYDVPLKLAINVSRQGLLREDIVSFYTEVKDEFDIEDNVLELEFTESVVLDDFDLFKETVISLQQNGFMCSIDDFGAGYSSMNVLKNLPIDVLKLDALFAQDIDDLHRAQTIVSYFIEMAHELNIITVAEGIEEEDQVHFLKEAKCDLIQGYVFSKPLPPAKFEEYISKDNGKVEIAESYLR